MFPELSRISLEFPQNKILQTLVEVEIHAEHTHRTRAGTNNYGLEIFVTVITIINFVTFIAITPSLSNFMNTRGWTTISSAFHSRSSSRSLG